MKVQPRIYSICSNLSNGNNMTNQAEKLLNELIDLTSAEREYAMKLEGEKLSEITRRKSQKLSLLREATDNGKFDPSPFRELLACLKNSNEVNRRLFRFLIRLGSRYKKLLAGTELLTGTYAANGDFDKNPLSLRVNRST